MAKYLPLWFRILILFCYCFIVLISRQDTVVVHGDQYQQLLQRWPEQTLVSPSAIVHGKYKLSIKAHYKIAARVLGVEQYYFDWMSNFSSVDLLLGWGMFSDINLVKKNIENIYQNKRAVYYYVSDGNPLEKKINHSVANTHVIAANNEIKSYISQKVKINDLIYLEGDLVDVVDEDKMIRADTSLSREDQSPGGCEILLVRKVSHLLE